MGLPSVIAHGMYTMAQAGKFVTEWAGDIPVPSPTSASLLRHGPGSRRHRFPEHGGATIEISGKVLDKLGDNKVTVDIVARADGAKVLTRARATVRLP